MFIDQLVIDDEKIIVISSLVRNESTIFPSYSRQKKMKADNFLGSLCSASSPALPAFWDLWENVGMNILFGLCGRRVLARTDLVLTKFTGFFETGFTKFSFVNFLHKFRQFRQKFSRLMKMARSFAKSLGELITTISPKNAGFSGFLEKGGFEGVRGSESIPDWQGGGVR
jgi:hypothetical protein